MDGETTAQVVKLVLEFLRETANSAAQVGFQMSMRYVIADATVRLGAFTISAIGEIISLRAFVTAFQKEDDNEIALSKRDIAMLISGILVAVLALGMSLCEPLTAIKMLIAPEWYAISNIVQLVK